MLSPEDRFENHIEDTLTAGAGLCDRAVVEMVVREAPEQIGDLINWGTHFDLEDGHLALGREGGHSHHRIVHALGDATGFEVMRAMIKRVRQASNVTIWERTFTLDLLVHEGRCVGTYVARPRKEKLLVWAKQTILASGGCGMIYRETTNPPVATGDGMAAAYRAGAELRDMEFMQFHPTVLYVAGSSPTPHQRGGARRRGLPARQERRALHAGRRSARRAGAARCGRPGHRAHAWSGRSIPMSISICRTLTAVTRARALPRHRQVLPRVRPRHHARSDPGAAGAHYMIGGVTVDPEGRTTLPGLWAAGEVTSSGLHGANRLASNSLLEGLVYGSEVRPRCRGGGGEDAGHVRGAAAGVSPGGRTTSSRSTWPT